MIVPFWSWNLSDTTHVRSHTKFQLVWAINTAFTLPESAPPLTQMCSWDPLTIRVNNQLVNGSGYEEIVLISDGDTVLKHLNTSVLIEGDYYKGKHMHHCVYFEY